MAKSDTAPNPTLLIIDDDPDTLHLLTLIFQGTGVRLQTAGSGREGLRLLYQYQPDLVLLDLLMPDMDGWETLVHIREATDIPVLLMTNSTDNSAIVRAMELGALEYIAKPFEPNLLVARVKAILRFIDQPAVPPMAGYTDPYLTIDLETYRVFVDGQLVHLSDKERKILFYLVSHANHICTYTELLEDVWGWEYRESTHYIHVYLSRLRHKIERDPKQPEYLLKAHGVGYQFRKQI